MTDSTNFFGYDFETGHLLFADFDSLLDIPGVYLIYTEKTILDIGQTDKLRLEIESHPNTRSWIEAGGADDIFLGFHFDKEKESRQEKVVYLRDKLQLV